MRSPALIRHINALTAKRLHDRHPGPARPVQPAQGPRGPRRDADQLPRHRPPAHRHRPGPRRPHRHHHQRPPTSPTRALISQYARRMTIEQRLAEIIQAFCADALSSTVNLNVDLDVVLCVLAQALLAALRTRLARLRRRHPRHPATPLPRHPRHHHHHRRHHHRPPRPPRLLTRPAPGRPARRHHRPLVGQPPLRFEFA